LRSNGQQLSRPFFFLKVFGDFVVPNVAAVTRTSELKQGRPRVHDEGAAGVGDRRHDLRLGILPVTRIARELLSVDGYGSHRTLLAARFVVRAPEGWICQRSRRVPWLVPLVTQTLLSRTRPYLRVYCKTAKPLAHRWSPFAPLPTTEVPTTHSNSRSKIKLRRNRVKNTPEGFSLSLLGLHQPPWSFGFDSQTRGTM
jgi:hypothetical protein